MIWTEKTTTDAWRCFASVTGRHGSADIVIMDSSDGYFWACHGDSIKSGYANTIEQAKAAALKYVQDDIGSIYKDRQGCFR
jgi:hypothetical protein